MSSFCRDRKLYLVTELTHDNLNNIIRTQRLKNDDVRYIIFQILNGLNYLHNCGITHGDLKPSDIGLNKDFSIKIIDLNVEQPKEADYVLTKWFVCLFLVFEKLSFQEIQNFQVPSTGSFVRMESHNAKSWFVELRMHNGRVPLRSHNFCWTWSYVFQIIFQKHLQ